MKSIALLFLVISVMACTSEDCGCDQPNSDIVIGEGPVVSKEYDVASFSSVSILSFTDIRIETGKEQKVMISGQKNIMDLLELEVDKGNLDLGFSSQLDIRPTEDLTATITMPNALEAFSFIGLAEIELLGESQNNLIINITGSGNVNSLELATNNVIIIWTGEGTAKVQALEQLILNCVGVFDITYLGEPAITNNSVGTVSVRPIQ